MYISKEQLAARLAGQANLEIRGRRGIGKHKELPRETKILAAALASVDTQENVAKAFGTSQENISHIVNGVGEKNSLIQGDIKSARAVVKEKVSSKAIDLLMSSLEVVDRKVGKESAKEASVIARNMASIVNDFDPNQKDGGTFAPKILINIHGSKQKPEDDYEVVDVEAVSQ